MCTTHPSNAPMAPIKIHFALFEKPSLSFTIAFFVTKIFGHIQISNVYFDDSMQQYMKHYFPTMT